VKSSNNLKELIGKSKAIQRIKIIIKKVHSINYPVLITGETGVGKELVGQYIHYMGSRKNKPFMQINSANILESLLESELFGCRKGAFTDAKEDKHGLLEEANGGTVFFDEISELPVNLQSKLLRVIDNYQIRRLGETKIRIIDVRFIFATNADLKKEIKKQKFREDIYYRISAIKLHIPPLRERKEDIPLLIDYFLREENKKNNRKKRLSQEAENKLLEYTYPGNIRELNNIILRAYIFSANIEIKKEDIILEEKNLDKGKKSRINPMMINQVLKKYKGNKTKAAKELGLSRMQLYRILKKL
jgi:DNA-binding NtrC family response regulator